MVGGVDSTAKGEKVKAILAYIDKHGYTSIKGVAKAMTAAGEPTQASLVRYAMLRYRAAQYEVGKSRNSWRMTK
jgi:hypothetical protein